MCLAETYYGQNCAVDSLSYVWSLERSRQLNLPIVTRPSRLCWAVLVCLTLLAEPVWANPFRVVAVGASNTSGWTDTTAGMLARLPSAVRGGTDLVILQPGANDRRFFVSPERRATNIAEIKDHLRSRRIAAIVFDRAFPDDYYSFDRIHFTPEAHARIAAELMPEVIKQFERIRPHQNLTSSPGPSLGKGKGRPIHRPQ